MRPGILAPENDLWLSPTGPVYRFPTRVIPLGFALNTLIVSSVVLAVVEGIGFVRRRRRRALCDQWEVLRPCRGSEAKKQEE